MSVIFQIFGNLLLVWAIITRSFSELVHDSAVNISTERKRITLQKSLKTKTQIIIGLFYVVIGLIISIQYINDILNDVILFQAPLFLIFFSLGLVLLAIGITYLIQRINRKKIDKATLEKNEGDLWVEDNDSPKNSKEIPDDTEKQLSNIPFKNKNKSSIKLRVTFLAVFVIIILLIIYLLFDVTKNYKNVKYLESQVNQLIYLNSKINEIDETIVNSDLNNDLLIIRKELLLEKNNIVNEIYRTNSRDNNRLESEK